MQRTLLPSLLLICAVFLLFEFTGIDLWVQDHFYDFHMRSWLVDAEAAFPKLIFYNGAKALVWCIGLMMMVAALFHGKFVTLFPRIAFARCDIWVVVATLATAPSLVALGKATTNTFTPAQIQRYGGEQPYEKVLEIHKPIPGNTKRGRGFPAGHASGGFALLSLAGLATTRRGRTIGIAIGLIFGTTMGAYQMLKGAHYLSHTLVTAGLCWIVFLAWRSIFYRISISQTSTNL